MPQAMTIKQLLGTNPKIDLAEIDLLMGLYAGGRRFEKFKPEFLIHREAETLGLANIKSRLKRAQYINRAAGLVDWVVSSATSSEPKIIGDNEYWEELNKNSDGMGTPFSSLCRQLLADMLVARWPYVEARAIGNDPYTIWRRDPETVYDFENDENGNLVWIKTVCTQQDRSQAFTIPDREKVIITFYTDTDTVSYTVYRTSNGQYTAADGSTMSTDAVVSPDSSASVYGHDFGSVPVFRGNATKTHWLMDRISEALKAIYNTEVDLSFSLSQCAYAQLIFKLGSKERANQITRSEAGAWILETGEEALYLAPPNTAFEGLFTNLNRLNDALKQSLQMMASETADIPQAGRLSGDAVREHRKPLETIVKAISWPVVDMLNRCLGQIAEAMGIDAPVIVGIGDGPEIEVDSAGGVPSIDENGEAVVDGDIGQLNTSQETVLNGAQVGAAVEIVDLVSTGELPRSSGIGMLVMFFNMSQQEAEAVMGPAGTDAFVPTVEESKGNEGSEDGAEGSNEEGSKTEGTEEAKGK